MTGVSKWDVIWWTWLAFISFAAGQYARATWGPIV